MIEVFVSKSLEPYYNLAFEEYLVYNYKTSNPILYLWQNENTIVVGRNQNTYEQVKVDVAKNDKVNIVRRNTGGGTVFHDLGNICYSLISNLGINEKFSIKESLEPIINFLKSKNLNVEFSGKNDLKINGFKISGNAELKTKEKLLVHGTLLYDVELSKIQKYLTLNKTKMISKKIKSNVSMVKNILEFMNEQNSSRNFLDEMVSYFKKNNNIEIKELKSSDENEIEKIKKLKYLSWEWNYGKSATFEHNIEKYIPEKGTVKFSFDVKEGKFTKANISGDFLGYLGTEDLENKLIGTLYKKEETKNILKTINIKEMFGENFTTEDLLEVIY